MKSKKRSSAKKKLSSDEDGSDDSRSRIRQATPKREKWQRRSDRLVPRRRNRIVPTMAAAMTVRWNRNSSARSQYRRKFRERQLQTVESDGHLDRISLKDRRRMEERQMAKRIERAKHGTKRVPPVSMARRTDARSVPNGKT